MTAVAEPSIAASEDIGNIVSFEHVNVRIPEQAPATLFYVVGMGFTRDPYQSVGLNNMWINVGNQQFHTPIGAPQVLRGHVGIVMPDLKELQQRLEMVQKDLAGTQFGWSVDNGHVDVTSPWGNLLRCYEPDRECFGEMQMGIPYVEFTVPQGSAGSILGFYEKIMGAPGRLEERSEGTAAVVQVGYDQEFIFQETHREIPPYDGHHVAVYVNNFSGPYSKLRERGLVTEEPAPGRHQIRFVTIADPDTGEKVFDIEHEVRSMKHPQYKRELANRLLNPR